MSTRRQFIKNATYTTASTLMISPLASAYSGMTDTVNKKKLNICGHLWVYASNYAPNWDCTPILEDVFADMSYAGLYGVELMEVVLRHDDAVQRMKEYSKEYGIKVSGSSYGVGFQMCDKAQHKRIWEDIRMVVPRLAKLGGETFGISVGGIGRKKTEQELDHQAELLIRIIAFCSDYDIQHNLHNHTYEVENDLHDLKGTLQRVPEAKLGPDINWLIRAGVDPLNFLKVYGDRIVYMHLRDQYKNGEWTEYVGQGNTDFIALGSMLNTIDFKGLVGIELAFPNNFKPKNTLKVDWKKSREYIQETFSQI
ncbi:MAG: sugar phosphate isomerase/epimerase family protein [Croceivirga sp.]